LMIFNVESIAGFRLAASLSTYWFGNGYLRIGQMSILPFQI